jgi:hypothetical protein
VSDRSKDASAQGELRLARRLEDRNICWQILIALPRFAGHPHLSGLILKGAQALGDNHNHVNLWQHIYAIESKMNSESYGVALADGQKTIDFDTVRNLGLALPGRRGEHSVRGSGTQGTWKNKERK